MATDIAHNVRAGGGRAKRVIDRVNEQGASERQGDGE